MTTRRQFRRRLRLAILAPWLLLSLLALTASTPAFRQLLLDSANHPTSDLALNSSHIVGTLDAARLPVGTASGTVAAGNDSRFPASVTGLRYSAGAGGTDTAATGAQVSALVTSSVDSNGTFVFRGYGDSALTNGNFAVYGTPRGIKWPEMGVMLYGASSGTIAIGNGTPGDGGGTLNLQNVKLGEGGQISRQLGFGGITFNPDNSVVLGYSGGVTVLGGSLTASGTIAGSGAGITSLNASNLASGTVPDARLSAHVLLLDGSNGIYDQGGGFWSISKLLGFYGSQAEGIYGDGPSFIWNDGGVRFSYDGNYIQGLTGGGTIDFTEASFSADLSNCTNAPSPDGLYLDANGHILTGFYGGIQTGSFGSICASVISSGDLLIGDGSNPYGYTQLLSGPNTLGSINIGGAMVLIQGAYEPLLSNSHTLFDANGDANYANYANNDFDSFFHLGGYNADISLPGDGTASFANGACSIQSDGSVVIDGGALMTDGSGNMVFSAERGPIVFSPNGTQWIISVNNAGTVIANSY